MVFLGCRHIYGKASKGIVWLHSTSWPKDSALKRLLQLELQEPKNGEPADMQRHVDQAADQLDAAREEEYWLRSGWTLQEGVLLHETDLIDLDGNVLPGSEFFINDQANVCDLTIPISKIAYLLGIAHFINSQGHEPDIGTPSPQSAYALSKMPEMWLRQSLQRFMASGFVGFWKESPLDILSGKRGRRFGNVKDKCWALVGALGIDKIEVTYDDKVPMEEVKRRLLVALIDKYQWVMLSLPFPEFRITEKTPKGSTERKFEWIDIADGIMLPVHAFCVEVKTDPEHSREQLPVLSYVDDLRIKAPSSGKITLYRAPIEGDSWYRHYRQDKNGLMIVPSQNGAIEGDRLLSTAWLLHLSHINMKVGVPGRRCLALLGRDGQDLDLGASPMQASFGGIIDIRDIGHESVEVEEIVLHPSP